MTPEILDGSSVSILEHQPLSFEEIVLDQYQLWAGMRVNVVGQNGLIEGQSGPLVLNVSNGGSPIRPGSYDDYGNVVFQFDPSNKYTPTQAYDIGSAPMGDKYAVFKDGEAVRYKGKIGQPVYVSISEDGSLKFGNWPQDWENDRDFDLEDCQLIKINIEKQWAPDAIEAYHF